jgi:hypothetical protein
MYLLLKYVPGKDFESRRNSCANPRNLRDIQYLYELRIEFTNDYEQFSSYICECNFKTEADLFEVYDTPYPSTEKNRELRDQSCRYQKIRNPMFKTLPLDYWLQMVYLSPRLEYTRPQRCPSCYTVIDGYNSGVWWPFDYYSNRHVLILELPEAPIDTIICDLVKYIIVSKQNELHFSLCKLLKLEYGQLSRDLKYLECTDNNCNQYIPILLAYQKEKWAKHTHQYIRTMLVSEMEKKLRDWKEQVRSESNPSVYEPEEETNLDDLD